MNKETETMTTKRAETAKT